MTTYRIRFEGPPSLALGVATALAESDGVELTSSQPMSTTTAGTLALDVTVEGASIAVGSAIDRIRDTLPPGASIDVDG